VLAVLAILGLVVLSYVFGAAVIYFELPTSDFLQNGFSGAEAWFERSWLGHGRSPGTPIIGLTGTQVRADVPDRTFDGYTLFTTSQGSWATLIDMRGNVVHQWNLPFRKAWPAASHVRAPLPDERIHWFRCHLYPNGDLLAVYHGDDDTPYGYGLVKLDKDSKLLWTYAGNVHHDVTVAEDGTIYTLAQKIEDKLPAGLESIRGPYIADYLVVLSPQGRELKTIPILEAFRDSPYALALTLVGKPALKNRARRKDLLTLLKKGDILHTNSVRVLSQSLAAKFPLFKAGQVLISVRSLDTIAVLDPQTRCVVWAAQGLWRAQHDAEFLDNGHLLVFDNLGSLEGARVIEYDPVTQAMPWSYGDDKSARFIAVQRGVKQRLPNGNTLIVEPVAGRIVEVTRNKELVWECFCSSCPVAQGQRASSAASIASASRYSPKGLSFLKGGPRARP
jgi:hypothetical protein